jgi:hypothetical protein
LAPSVFAQTAPSDIDKLAFSDGWLKLLQYELVAPNTYQSAIFSPQFFFSSTGKNNPLDELIAARNAFRLNDPRQVWGTLRLPAACAFPARFEYLKINLHENWPQPNCPDLQEWMNGIHADSVSLVYASSYIGNPASILGHTFLRFFNAASEADQPDMSLLSYAVGYLAYPDPNDSPLAGVRIGQISNGVTQK